MPQSLRAETQAFHGNALLTATFSDKVTAGNPSMAQSTFTIFRAAEKSPIRIRYT
jgi:hypothetical protein